MKAIIMVSSISDYVCPTEAGRIISKAFGEVCTEADIDLVFVGDKSTKYELENYYGEVKIVNSDEELKKEVASAIVLVIVEKTAGDETITPEIIKDAIHVANDHEVPVIGICQEYNQDWNDIYNRGIYSYFTLSKDAKNNKEVGEDLYQVAYNVALTIRLSLV